MANPVALIESATVGVAIGEAAAAAFEPDFEGDRQDSWKNNPVRVLGIDQAAQLVAQGLSTPATAYDQAAREGYGPDKVDALVQIALKAPGVAEGLTLWRRGFIDQAQFIHVLRKSAIEADWDGALQALKDQPLPPAVAALAAVRGLIDAEGFLPVNPPTGAGNIQPFPVYPISGKDSAAAVGLSSDAYGVMVGINGRPMSLHEAASAYFRGIITLDDYYRAVSEGDTRNEWRDAILDQARQILTAHDWVELHLRGYISQQEMYDGTGLHGMSPADSDLLFKVLGRPLTVHQITTGLARGGQFNPLPNEIKDPYQASVHEANIKPSYYDLAIANRYNYPSLFQLNTLVKGNAIDAATAVDWATKDGYAPEVIVALDKYWTSLSAPAGGKKLTYSQIHQAFRAGTLGDVQAAADLENLGYSPAQAQLFLDTWRGSSAPPNIP